MANYSVKLKSDGQYYLIEDIDTPLKVNEEVIVETDHGMEVAFIVPKQEREMWSDVEKKGKKESQEDSEKLADEGKLENQRKIIFIRRVNQKDRDKIDKLSSEANSYLLECHKKIEKYKLPMQLLDASLSFDEKKLTFYFTAPERVDFRILVSDLAHSFKKIIRLQQVGARDEARYLGGVGRCGEGLCCKRFLKGNLESVTLDMAYDQDLAQMGSNRVTGVCGKLMCCLKYELEDYQKAKSKMPRIGQEIETEKGKGKVISQSILKKTVSVKLNDSDNVVEVNC